MVNCTRYTATRITYSSAHGFAETRAGFEERVPLFDQTVALELVLSGATWAAVEAAVNDRVGSDGLVALARRCRGRASRIRPTLQRLRLVGIRGHQQDRRRTRRQDREGRPGCVPRRLIGRPARQPTGIGAPSPTADQGTDQ